MAAGGAVSVVFDLDIYRTAKILVDRYEQDAVGQRDVTDAANQCLQQVA